MLTFPVQKKNPSTNYHGTWMSSPFSAGTWENTVIRFSMACVGIKKTRLYKNDTAGL